MVNSPCIAVCRLKDDICIGCYRTGHEISIWRDSPDHIKLSILENVKRRQQELQPVQSKEHHSTTL